jgi:hypothetical protein
MLLLTVQHKGACMDVSLHLLQQHAALGDGILLNIMTGDDSWLTLKENNGAQNGIMLILQRRMRSEPYPWLEKLGEKFSGMPRGAYWLVSCPGRKLSVCFAMFMCTSNSDMHFVTRAHEKTHHSSM